MKLPNIALPSQKTITRLLFLSTIIFALLTGLYQELYRIEQKKYANLENMYVRVRSQLGRTETQRLIDESYNK
ncbi:MAG TPA: hypothetical protein PKJ26_01920 [Candidatus Woesebacteria bacterium]|jgi:hypothetical protein|nr:hypothetical protein [Candidatus Woesebacteria bacterium]HNS65234.1 hypothetical protein [Candidatus Woesebacteria bacterium]